MSLNDKKIARRYKSLFIVSLVLFVLALSFWISEIYTDDTSDRISEIEERYEAQVERNQILLDILEIDGRVFKNQNYEDAINDYQSLVSDDLDKDLNNLLKNRIDNLYHQLKDINQNTQTRENLISSLNRQISENQALQDELNTYNTDTKTELSDKNKSIDSLKNVLADTKSKLNRKENVQVLSFTNENSNLIRYLGEVKNGKANGGGVGIWDTGSIYKGDWEDNKRHGQGVFEWADGQKYEGNFDNDIRTGEGTYYWPSGEKYVGEFKNNRINGKGTLYNLDGEIEYEGEWKNGKPKP